MGNEGWVGTLNFLVETQMSEKSPLGVFQALLTGAWEVRLASWLDWPDWDFP